MELGETIKALRRQRGWTKGQVALRAGISRGYVSRLERGEFHNPSQRTLEGFARAFQVTVEYLIEGRRVKPETQEDRLLDWFRQLTDDDREEVMEVTERKAERRRKRRNEHSQGAGS